MYSFAVNYVTVLIATVASMAVGTIWYSPQLFGKKWSGLVGLTTDNKTNSNNMALTYLASFLLTFLMSYIVAVFMKNLFLPTLYEALLVGLCLWLGFVATVLFNQFLFNPARRSLTLFAIDSGYYLVILFIQTFLIFFLR